MCGTRQVLVLVALSVGLVHSWDIAVALGDRLEFYTNGTKTDTVNFKSHNVTAIAYDEIHNMMLFVDKQSDNDAICGYNLASMDIRCFIKRYRSNIEDLAFDPATDLLFFTDTKEGSINWISLKGHGSETYYPDNLLIKMDDRTISNIAVDSCRGYIYWTNKFKAPWEYMERARFDGSEREVVYKYLPVYSFAIDPQTQRNYYVDGFEQSVNEFLRKVDLSKKYLNSGYAPILFTYHERLAPKELTVSNDYLYWMNSSVSHTTIWQGAKNADSVEPREICRFYSERPLGIAANYRISEQVQGLQNCEALSSLTPTIAETKNSHSIEQAKQKQQTSETQQITEMQQATEAEQTTEAEHITETEQITDAEQTTERYEVQACHGYCLNNGACSLNEKNEPVCQCKGKYVGDRCEVSECLNYCFQGICSFNDEGYPECRCNAGYSGERCEVAACHGYCLNNGECTLNEEDEPACQCVGNYEGSRCEAVIDDTITNAPQCHSVKRNLTLADLLSKLIIIDV